MSNELLDLTFNKNPKETAYFVGFFWADGAINYDKYLVIEFLKEDGEQLANIFEKVANFKITTRERKGRRPQITFFLNDKESVEILKKLGKYPKTVESHEKILNFIPEEYRVYFLRGLIDGDGCFYSGPANKKWNNNTIHFTIGARYNQDWDGLIRFTNNMGLNLKVIQKINESKNTRYSCVRESNFEKIESFIKQLYEPNDGIFLRRKYDKIMSAINEHKNNILQAIERRKKFKITYKDGTSIVINNLREFSKINGYCYDCLCRAANKKHKYKDILIEHN